jgi:hypothetical protein
MRGETYMFCELDEEEEAPLGEEGLPEKEADPLASQGLRRSCNLEAAWRSEFRCAYDNLLLEEKSEREGDIGEGGMDSVVSIVVVDNKSDP